MSPFLHGIVSLEFCYCATVKIDLSLPTEQFCLQQLIIGTNPRLAGLFHQDLSFWLTALSSPSFVYATYSTVSLPSPRGVKNLYLRRLQIPPGFGVSKCMLFSFTQSGEIQTSWEKLKQLQEWILVPLKITEKEGKRKGRRKNIQIWQTSSSRLTLLVPGLRRKSSISKKLMFSKACEIAVSLCFSGTFCFYINTHLLNNFLH